MNLLRIFILTLVLHTSTIYADTAKVVYDLTSDDIVKIDKHLINSIKALGKYYKEEKTELKIIVVISGNAYKYFVEDLKNSPYAQDDDALDMQEQFKHKLAYLNESLGVTFNMCSSGMKAR